MTVTVITGAGRGIGAAVAVRLAAIGHHLVLNYAQDETAARALADRLPTETLLVQADVADPDAVDELFGRSVERFGAITGLVNNAGNTLHVGQLTDTPVATIRRVLEVNLHGAIWCARAAAALMIPAGQGAIVNVSSAAATLGAPGEYVHYAAAKAGVDALTVGLAKELAPHGIRVNGVAPGPGQHPDPRRCRRPGPAAPGGSPDPGRPGR